MSMETKQGKRGIRKWESMKLNILCMSDVEFRLFEGKKKMSNTVKQNYFIWSLIMYLFFLLTEEEKVIKTLICCLPGML